jgi:hypothetical protein
MVIEDVENFRNKEEEIGVEV